MQLLTIVGEGKHLGGRSLVKIKNIGKKLLVELIEKNKEMRELLREHINTKLQLS